MVSPSPLAGAAFSRRTLLAASAAGMAVLLVGCTSDEDTPPVSPQQADALAGQVGTQVALVAAFAAATAADPALAGEVAEMAGQVQEQLDRLRKAAPGATSSAGPSSPPPPAAPDARGWLAGRIGATADSHASACLDQTGGRAALLGSIAAGLRGMAGRLA